MDVDRFSRVLAAAGLLFASVCAAAEGQTALPSPQPPGSLTADAIYDNARVAVSALDLPPYLAYTADFTLERKGRIEARHERIYLRTADGHAYVRNLPDSPADRVDAQPRVVTEGAKDDPATAMPLTTFGLRPRKAGGEFLESPATPQPSPSPDHSVIGSVKAVDRAYALEFAGTGTVDGRDVYHLVLTPRRDPLHNRIRELFVDEQTFVPLRYVIEVEALAGPFRKSFFITCDTQAVGPHRLIVRAETSLAFRALFVSFAGTGRYVLRDISYPPALPAWMFDPAAIKAHAGDPVPGEV